MRLQCEKISRASWALRRDQVRSVRASLAAIAPLLSGHVAALSRAPKFGVADGYVQPGMSDATPRRRWWLGCSIGALDDLSGP